MNLRQKLLRMKKQANNLQSAVIKDILKYSMKSSEIKRYLEEVTRYGCVSGVATNLATYNATHRFFDKNYDQIIQLKSDYEAETGEPLKLGFDIKNELAWFAYEQTVLDIYYRVNCRRGE